MSSRNHWRANTLLTVAGALLIAWQTAGAQGDYTISDNVDLVLLDASVKDVRGGFVTGLARGDFRVYEDGHERAITHFAPVDAPVSVGLVLDDSGSMRRKRAEVVTAGLAFAKESNPKDEFFVVNFNNRIYYGLPQGVHFTDKLKLLHNALYFGQPVGQTALYDAIASALKHLELSDRELRTLIVVSDGGDNVSKIRLPELMKLIETSRATIYTVGLLDPEDRDLNPKVLRRFAYISGGEFFEPTGLDEVVPIFQKISKDIRNRYTIGFTPDERSDKRKSRSIKVTAQSRGRKLNVRTRSTFSLSPANEIVAKAPVEHVSEK